MEATMRYRPDNAPGATQSEQEPKYFYKVFEGDEVESCLEDGWFASPDDFKKEVKKKPAAKGKK